MNIRTDIICSEYDVDLKDKVAMGETEFPKQPNTNIDEKTLADPRLGANLGLQAEV